MAKNLVVVGGGAAGPSVAAEANRGDPSLAVTIVEQGEHVSYAA
jgi:CoA-dependent NAD(P)H sulfur oxidoreductase